MSEKKEVEVLEEDEKIIEINVTKIKEIFSSGKFWAASAFLAGNLTGFLVGNVMAGADEDADEEDWFDGDDDLTETTEMTTA